MLSKTLSNAILLVVLTFAAHITGCTDEYQSKIRPNITLPTQYPGFILSGKRPDGTSIEVLVALASENQQLILKDRTKPVIDPNCPSGCRLFWGIKGPPEISYSLPTELARTDQYRFQAVGHNADFEITFFLMTDSGSQQIDAQSWKTLPTQKFNDIAFFEATFDVKRSGSKLPTVSLGFTVTEQGIPIQFQP